MTPSTIGTAAVPPLPPFVIDPRTTLDHVHLIVRSLDAVCVVLAAASGAAPAG
jgi:hypothetical protein